MSKDGKNFEKKAILDWLNRGNVNCPLTRQPLKPSLLIPNNNLKMSITRWKQNLGVPDKVDDDSSSSSETENDFVGLLQVEENSSEDSTPNTTEISQADSIEDELRDLLDLYNEVLELTSTPLDFGASAATATTR